MEQYNTLTRYVELYQQDGGPYWTGYSYNASNILVDVNGDPPMASSPVLEANNYRSSSSAPETNGSCVLIGQDGNDGVRLFRELCSVQQRYICTQIITGKPCGYVCGVLCNNGWCQFLHNGWPVVPYLHNTWLSSVSAIMR